MDASSINWLAVIAATLSDLVVGGLWFSPLLFDKVWKKANGFTAEDLQGRNMGLIFGLVTLMALIISVNLAFFLADDGNRFPDLADRAFRPVRSDDDGL